MNQRHLLLMLIFAMDIFHVANLNAQQECALTIVSIDYGQAILPNVLAGECKPQNTLDLEVLYTKDMSDSLMVNGKIFPTTGSPQTIQITGVPRELIVELVGTGCYYFENTDLPKLPLAPIMVEGDTVYCEGEPIPPITLAGHPNSHFFWSNKDGSCVQSLFFSGTYNEEWTRPHPGEFAVHQYVNGMVTAPLYINIREGLPVEIIGQQYFCEGDSTTLSVLVDGQKIKPYHQVKWYTPVGVKYNVASINADVGYLYFAEVMDNEGCIGSTSVWVRLVNAPRLNILLPQLPISNNDLRVVGYGSTCLEGCDYLWQTPNGATLNSQIIQAPVKGTYNVTVTGRHGCAISKDIIVK